MGRREAELVQVDTAEIFFIFCYNVFLKKREGFHYAKENA